MSAERTPHSEFRVIEETLRRFFMEEDDADFAEAINALRRIEEQLEAAQRERDEWASKCQMLVEAVESFQAAAYPASRQDG